MRTADSIIVMEQGRVVEEGTHEDLVLEGGIYASLVARQTSTASKASKDPRLVSKGADSVADVHRALAKQVVHSIKDSWCVVCQPVTSKDKHQQCYNMPAAEALSRLQAQDERDASLKQTQSNGKASTGDIPEGQEASNAVPISKRIAEASSDSVDETQLLEECNPDLPEPARGKNKHSRS